MKQSHKTILLWMLLILMFVSIWQFSSSSQRGRNTIPFSDFIQRVEDGQVSEIHIKGDEIQGKSLPVDGATPQPFTSIGEIGDDVQKSILAKGVSVTYEKREQGSFWQSLIITWLPMLFLFLIFFFFMRQLQSGGGKAMQFGKSKAKLLTDHQGKVTFDDIAGIEEAKEELAEIIEFLKEPKKFTRLGGRIPKGVLLMGPPGSGKTLLARGVAGEAGVPFFSISGSDFVEMFVGVGASRVRDLFEQGKKNAPCIVFIDEIDAVGRHRGAGLGGGHDEREQTLNQLLVEMDGFESNDGVILVAATNRPDVLDPALLRPGRFDRRVVVPLPDVRGREGILNVHARKVPLSDDVELSVIARGTPGFSGADLENVVNESALLAAREGRDQVFSEHFERAKDKVLMGAEMKSRVISDKEKRITAYHEAGHTLVGALLPGSDPIHKVTIIPRGRALGLTQMLPAEDRHSLTEEEANIQIAFAMGGRVAEEVVFGKRTTGAGNDIERATELARKMVCEWGMSEKMGPLTYGKVEEQIFLGKEIGRSQDYSGQTAIEIDQEIRSIVDRGYERATEIVNANLDKLTALAEGLLEYETLTGDEVLRLIGGEPYMELREHPEAEEAGNADASDASPSYATRLKDEVLKKVRGGEDDEETSSPVAPPSPQGNESS